MNTNDGLKPGFKRAITRNYSVVLVFAVSALIGIYLLGQSNAQTTAVSVEAESGTVAGAATIQSGSNATGASAGRAVKFGTVTPPNPTPPNPPNPPTPNPPTPPPTGMTGGCFSGGVAAPCIGSSTTAATGWGTPVFADEFNGGSLNRTYWAPDWFGGGTMNDVKTNAANVSVSGGNLILTLKSSSEGALVSTNPNGGARTGFQFSTGYAEARVYFPGSGSTIYNWPAWWTDGQNWPANGEIDIAEGLGTLTSNYHSNAGANNSNTVAGTWSNDFHTYAVDRQQGKNLIYWDGKLIRTYNTIDGNSPHYFIINVGDSGQRVLGAGSQVKVDYVRVWRR